MRTIIKISFVLIFNVTLFSCNKETIDQSQFNIDSSNTFLKCIINDNSIELNSNATITTGSGKIFPADSLDSVNISYSYGIAEQTNVVGDKNSFEIIFYENLHNSVIDVNEIIPDSIFRGIFTAGQKSFIENDSFQQKHENGILIIWTDKQGVSWATAKNVYNITDNDIQISTDRNFEITHSIYQEPDSQIKVNLHKIRATFNCVLYNIDGDSIVLSNGEFVGIFSNRNE